MAGRVAAAAVVGVLASAGLVAAPAYADGPCGSNNVCMWEDHNYTGSLYVNYVPGTIPGDAYNIDGWDGDNEITSVINHTTKWVVLYANDNFTGGTACIAPNSHSSNLGVTHGFNDDAESFKLKTSCS